MFQGFDVGMQIVAVEKDLQTTLHIVREQVVAQQRDPLRKFKERVRHLNYGPCAQLKPLSQRDVDRVDAHTSCNYYSRSFRDPSEFTLCFVGALPPPYKCTCGSCSAGECASVGTIPFRSCLRNWVYRSGVCRKTEETQSGLQPCNTALVCSAMNMPMLRIGNACR